MNHVTKHSPGNKVFKRCFVTFMAIATIVTYSSYSTEKSGEEIEQHDTIVQSNRLIAGVSLKLADTLEAQTVLTWRPPYVLKMSPNQIETNVLTQEEKVESEPKEHENIEEEVEVIKEERQNILYYVNDNGYKSYLDNRYQDFLYEMCIKYDVKEYYSLFLAQMYHESTFRTDIISESDDYGLMQINVCNHEWLSEILGNDNFLDPYNNIEAGIYIMSDYLHKYNDVEKALVCYNRGESAVINGTYSTSYSKGILHDMTLLVELN